MKRRIKINGFSMFLFTVLFLSFHKFFSGHWKYEFLDKILDITGLSFIYLGFILRISGRGYKSEKSKEGQQLVLDEPYSLVRNPMYLGILTVGIGIIFFLWRWWLVPVFTILFLFRFLPQIKKEEKLLSANFGRDYELYLQRVPRLFPMVPVFLKRNIKDILPFRYSWIKKEIFAIISITVITFIIELHEDVAHYGKLEYVKEAILLINVALYFILLFYYLARRKEDT